MSPCTNTGATIAPLLGCTARSRSLARVVLAVDRLWTPFRGVGTKVEVEVTTSRAAVAQGGGCSAVVSVQRACNPTEMAAAGHAPRAPTRAQPGAERSGLDKPGLVWTRG